MLNLAKRHFLLLLSVSGALLSQYHAPFTLGGDYAPLVRMVKPFAVKPGGRRCSFFSKHCRGWGRLRNSSIEKVSACNASKVSCYMNAVETRTSGTTKPLSASCGHVCPAQLAISVHHTWFMSEISPSEVEAARKRDATWGSSCFHYSAALMNTGCVVSVEGQYMCPCLMDPVGYSRSWQAIISVISSKLTGSRVAAGLVDKDGSHRRRYLH